MGLQHTEPYEADQIRLSSGGEHFRLAMENAAIGMSLVSADGRFLQVNRALCELLARDASSLMECTWQEVTHPDDVGADQSLVDDVLAGRLDRYRLLKRYVRPNGEVVWGDLSVACVRTPDGDVSYFITQIVDMTALEHSRATLAATLDALIDPHMLFTPVRDSSGQLVDLVVETLNDAACRHLDRPREQFVGHRVGDLYSDASVARLVGWCTEVLDGNGPLVVDDVTLLSSPGEEPRWFDLRAVRVDDSISFTWRDVSDRHRSAEDLAWRESRYRLLAENATDVIVRSDLGGGIEWVSPSVTEVLGWEPGQLLGRRVSDLIHPSDLEEARRQQLEIMAAGADEGRVTARFATARGGWRWMSDHGRLVRDEHGAPLVGIDALRDVTTEQEALAALRAREQELRGVVNTLLDPWVRLEAVRDETGQLVDFVYIDANDAACLFNRVPREELLGSRLLELLPAHRSSGIFDAYAAVVETGEPLVEDDVPFVSHLDGVQRRFDNRAVKVGDGISLTWRDVTERYEARQLLRSQAEHDILTGVANRRQLDRRLEELSTRAPRTGTRLALLYCDLDHFKEINDTLGHAVGDVVLLHVASAIRSAVRDGDLVARLGGDEFVVVLDGVRGVADAEAVANKVAAATRRVVLVEGVDIEPRLSVGVAVAGPGEDPLHALARADDALYAAKDGGRDRVVVDRSA